MSLFKFLTPFLKAADFEPASRDLYRGSLRLLLVLLHDFPEFLSEYYFTLCDVIPARCIQLRNIILSAFPSNITLPDPHLRNIDFDSIPEMRVIPAILSDFASNLKTGDLRVYLDQYLLNRGSPSFLPSLRERLRGPSGQDGAVEAYNVSLINSLVMYIGVSSVAQAKARSGSSLFVPTDPGVVALHYLATNLDIEGKSSFVCVYNLALQYSRTTSFAQLHGVTFALPQRSHPLVQLFDAIPLCGSEFQSVQGDYDQGVIGTIPRSPPSPLGCIGDIHRAPS